MAKSTKRTQATSKARLLIIILAVIGLILVGIQAYNSRQDEPNNNKEINKSSSQDGDANVPEVNNTKDLDKAGEALQEPELESTNDNVELENELNNF